MLKDFVVHLLLGSKDELVLRVLLLIKVLVLQTTIEIATVLVLAPPRLHLLVPMALEEMAWSFTKLIIRSS